MAAALERDLSLHNDVLCSLLIVCPCSSHSSSCVSSSSTSLASSRRGERFEDYTQAVRNLARDARFPADLVRELERLPGFRNVVVHDYVSLDMDRVVEALDRLEPVERFGRIVQDIEAAGDKDGD